MTKARLLSALLGALLVPAVVQADDPLRCEKMEVAELDHLTQKEVKVYYCKLEEKMQFWIKEDYKPVFAMECNDEHYRVFSFARKKWGDSVSLDCR